LTIIINYAFGEFDNNSIQDGLNLEEVEGFIYNKDKDGNIINIKPVKYKKSFFFKNEIIFVKQKPIFTWDEEKIKKAVPGINIDLLNYDLSKLTYRANLKASFKSGKYLIFTSVDASSIYKDKTELNTIIESYGIGLERRLAKIFKSKIAYYFGLQLKYFNNVNINRELEVNFFKNYSFDLYNSFYFQSHSFLLKFDFGVTKIYDFNLKAFNPIINIYFNLLLNFAINSDFNFVLDSFINFDSQKLFSKNCNTCKKEYTSFSIKPEFNYKLNDKIKFFFGLEFMSNKIQGFRSHSLSLSLEYQI
jgi:hypothetical protein